MEKVFDKLQACFTHQKALLVVSQSYVSRKNRRLKRARIENLKATARQLKLSLDGKYSSFPTRSIRRYLQKLGRRAYHPPKEVPKMVTNRYEEALGLM